MLRHSVAFVPLLFNKTAAWETVRRFYACRLNEHGRDFGSLLPEMSDYANAPTTERLCREVRGVSA